MPRTALGEYAPLGVRPTNFAYGFAWSWSGRDGGLSKSEDVCEKDLREGRKREKKGEKKDRN